MIGKAGRAAGQQPKKAAFLDSRASQQYHAEAENITSLKEKSTRESFHIARYYHFAMVNEFQEL